MKTWIVSVAITDHSTGRAKQLAYTCADELGAHILYSALRAAQGCALLQYSAQKLNHVAIREVTGPAPIQYVSAIPHDQG